MQSHPELLKQKIEKSLEINLPGNLDDALAFYINELIQQDFQKLITILYKVDIDEDKLKQILKNNISNDTASIIAKLIIERQLKKIDTRKQY
jgi:hypothetical protein